MDRLPLPIAHVWLGKSMNLLSCRTHLILFSFSLGEGCSHTAALMFKVECAVRLGYTSTTSQQCSWNETFCHKVSCLHSLLWRLVLLPLHCMQVEPSLIVDMKFQGPKRGRDVGTSQGEASAKPTKTPKLKPHTQEAENGFLRGLESILPSAVFFSSHQLTTTPAAQVIPLLSASSLLFCCF